MLTVTNQLPLHSLLNEYAHSFLGSLTLSRGQDQQASYGDNYSICFIKPYAWNLTPPPINLRLVIIAAFSKVDLVLCLLSFEP